MLNTKLFDHTILKADATEAQVAKICDEALAHDFASVCVNQYYTKFVAEKLKGSDVKVCTVVGFPLGMSDTRVKAFETRAAIEDGAQEVDMVINVGALKDGKYNFVRSDIQTLKEVCGKDIVLKVIIETCLLTDEEKVKACELAKEAGADFVKTSTGDRRPGYGRKSFRRNPQRRRGTGYGRCRRKPSRNKRNTGYHRIKRSFLWIRY